MATLLFHRPSRRTAVSYMWVRSISGCCGPLLLIRRGDQVNIEANPNPNLNLNLNPNLNLNLNHNLNHNLNVNLNLNLNLNFNLSHNLNSNLHLNLNHQPNHIWFYCYSAAPNCSFAADEEYYMNDTNSAISLTKQRI